MSIGEEEITALELKKKTRHGLIASILEECKEPKSEVNIFYDLHLRYSLIRPVLGLCLKAKLLTENNGKYQTTEKGQRYIDMFRGLLALLEEKGEEKNEGR